MKIKINEQLFEVEEGDEIDVKRITSISVFDKNLKLKSTILQED